MVRTLIAVAVLLCTTFFLPVWLQLCLYVGAILLVRHRALLLIPAFFADSWYAPERNFHLANNKTTLIVLVMILIYFFIMRTTRIRERYGLSKS